MLDFFHKGFAGEFGIPKMAPGGPEAAAGPVSPHSRRHMEESSQSRAERLARVCLEYAPQQLEIATSGFSVHRRLGSGGAGTVYRGTLRDGSDVAVKVIDLAALIDDPAMAGFEEEVAILSKFRHPNLVVLMGWARQGDKRFLVYEFLPGGDLSGRLRKCREYGGPPFLWQERLDVAVDAATGLAHLHNATPEAYHRDIKPPNILLGPGGAKVADFGLSCVSESRPRGRTEGLQVELPSGTPGYSCPQYLASRVITEASEVYSFGVVMLELLLNLPAAARGAGGMLVYPIEETVVPTHPGAMGRVMAALDQSAAWPAQVAQELAQLAIACTDIDAERRPSFNQVCRGLRNLRDRGPAAAQQLATMMPQGNAIPNGACPRRNSGFEGAALGVQAPIPQAPQLVAFPQVVVPGLQGPVVANPPGPAQMLPMPAPARPTVPKPKHAAAPAVVAAASAGSLVRLECVFCRCLSEEELQSLPEHLRMPLLPLHFDAPAVLFGRQHEPELFETLLARDPALCAQISRTHLRLEVVHGAKDAVANGWRLRLANVGQNPVLVCSSVLISNGEAAQITEGQSFSFAAPLTAEQGSPYAPFLTFRACSPPPPPAAPARLEPAQQLPQLQEQQPQPAVLLPAPRQAQPVVSNASTPPVPVQLEVSVHVESIARSDVTRSPDPQADSCSARIAAQHQQAPRVAAALQNVRNFGLGGAADGPSITDAEAAEPPRLAVTQDPVAARNYFRERPLDAGQAEPVVAAACAETTASTTERGLDGIANLLSDEDGLGSASSSRTRSPREREQSPQTPMFLEPEVAESDFSISRQATVAVVPAHGQLDHSARPTAHAYLDAAAASTVRAVPAAAGAALVEVGTVTWPQLCQQPSASTGAQQLHPPSLQASLATPAEHASASSAPPEEGLHNQPPPTEATEKSVRLALPPPQPERKMERDCAMQVPAQGHARIESGSIACAGAGDSQKAGASVAASGGDGGTRLAAVAGDEVAIDPVASSRAIKLEVLAETGEEQSQVEKDNDLSPTEAKRPSGGCRCFRLRAPWSRRRAV